VVLWGCNRSSGPARAQQRFASSEQVELNFRGRSFILGDNDKIAMVRPVGDTEERLFRLPFWLGVNILVPGVLQPKVGDYYVISEAELVRPLDNPDEWMIDAGSSLIKKETIFVATRTHFLSKGTILPMIVQYVGMREFTRGDGTKVSIPILREVSLPMRWSFKGPVPGTYARYTIR
jgi:hypothetical protein